MALLRSVIKNRSSKYYCVLNSINSLNKIVGSKAFISTVQKRKQIVKDTSIHTTDTNDKAQATYPKDKLDISFEDSRAAFKSKTTWELMRAYIVYMICSSSYIVDNNLKVSHPYLFPPHL